jgi:hypothetical protein
MKIILEEEDEVAMFLEGEAEGVSGQVLISPPWSATAAMNWGISCMNAQRKDSEQTLLTQVKRCC